MRIYRIFSETREELGQLNAFSPDEAVRDWNKGRTWNEPRAAYARIALAKARGMKGGE